MDPQQRAIMECTYHALENAGLRLQDVAGTRTSVHIGCFTSDFATMQFRDTQEIPKYNSLGTAGSMLANRISWFFDLHGESIGEGFAVLILKKLSRAIADGDPIRALIRSVGTNQDGRTSGGITQPSKNMQVQLIHETYRKAGLDMKHTRFFEAHGTGTPMGDPIEARAIGEAFFNYRSPEDPIYVGAVKSNVGHLEGASGLAGVVKTILALEKGIIPPNANFESLNPQIDADFFNLRFPVEHVAWPASAEGIRRASVNSFG
ncbi:putative polyketide [Diaporthe ampelina]|uniref:Putative polyketide n=1 Tax=Diaporthe ampelina TaxID=1214573 RepID=A0A0G2H232_9PEZI|nr:putative polyketide [Diaporthe ampelina]